MKILLRYKHERLYTSNTSISNTSTYSNIYEDKDRKQIKKGEQNMNVFSGFDGMRAARLSLRRAGIRVDNYYSSEIDKFAMQVANKNFPNDEKNQLGDITKIDLADLEKLNIGLSIMGFPCTSLSKNGKMEGWKGASGLFWKANEIIKKLDGYFIVENVAGGKKELENTISKELGVEPLRFNSCLTSAQKRPRLYWTNIPGVIAPADREIYLKDIVIGEHKIINDHPVVLKKENGKFWIKNATAQGYLIAEEGDSVNLSVPNSSTRRGRVGKGKTNTLDTACAYAMVLNGNLVEMNINEFERCQNLPVNYTKGVSLNQRKKMIGNGFDVDMVAHIASFLPSRK